MTDRPLECSQCKKPIKVLYKEIVGDVVSCSEMCIDCPILVQKLHGHTVQKDPLRSDKDTTLCCATCMTSLESVKTGDLLGCSYCYTVFEDALVEELLSEDKLFFRGPKEALGKYTGTLHVGKSLQAPVTLPPSTRLTSLNEALNEALKKENYEQAAWLRDQIKVLMEKSSEPPLPPT